MKKKIILLPVLGMFLYVLLTSNAAGPGQTSGIEGTGATGTMGCGAVGGGCHGSASSSSIGVTVQLLSGSTPVTAYTPGAAYTVRVTGTYTTSSAVSLPKFGFQVSAVKSTTTTNAGTLSTISGAHSYTATGSGIILIEHSSPFAATSGTGGTGTTYQVNIPWTAPVIGTGNVTLFGVINAVNFNGSEDANDKYNGGSTIITETITAVLPITGTLTVCTGSTTTLSDATTGGTWSSAATGVATISAAGIVTGISAGTATISYDAGVSGVATAIVTVNTTPASITGTASFCVGGTSTLASTTTGGTWTSGTPAVATVGVSSGIVTGVAGGTSIITYASSGCTVNTIVTINAMGAGAITGASTVCVGTFIHLTDPTIGGTWTSSTPAKATVSTAGIVTGVAVGTTTISYAASNSCGTATATHTVNVLAAGLCGAGVNASNASTPELKIFPNPNTGAFTLNLSSDNSEQVYVSITNMAGSKVKEFMTNTNSKVDLDLNQPPGIYFVSATTAHGTYAAKILID